MAILDGKAVKDSEIDPAKHEFVGTFRYPNPIDPKGCLIACPCGQMLHFHSENFEHWQRGHFDVPQYISIRENE